jgi:2-iminoacetate synthase
MTFFDEITRLKRQDVSTLMEKITPAQVAASLEKDVYSMQDFLNFLAPAATGMLEKMAQTAHALTVRHFGLTILLYTPLYLANYCVNRCVYCGFNASNPLPRRALTPDEVEAEARVIAASGLQHLLVLTGESRQHSSISYIRDCVQVLRRRFSSISIEIYPVSQAEYRELADAGVDGMTVYQEVYDEAIYLRLHPSGPKRNYSFRLEAPERAGRAGLRTLNIGALLGLGPWRSEVYLAGLHLAYLQYRFPEIELGISFPRMRPQYGDYAPEYPVSDRGLVQAMLAVRLFLPRAGITISTRESAALRERLLPLGVTKMSAGSSTVIGGHTDAKNGIGQFEISDTRSVEEMRRVIAGLGYMPVLKDWHDLSREGEEHNERIQVP